MYSKLLIRGQKMNLDMFEAVVALSIFAVLMTLIVLLF